MLRAAALEPSVRAKDTGGMMLEWSFPSFPNPLYIFPETNSSHLKIDDWNTILFSKGFLFRGELLVSGDCIFSTYFRRQVHFFMEAKMGGLGEMQIC